MRNASFFRNKSGRCQSDYLAFIIVFITVAPFGSSLTWRRYRLNMMIPHQQMEGYHSSRYRCFYRDLLVRTAIGGRIPLPSVLRVSHFVTIGTICAIGYVAVNRYVDDALLEILSSFPFMFFVILLVTLFGQTFSLLFIAIGRLFGLVLLVSYVVKLPQPKNKEFVEAISFVAPRRQIIFKHII